MKHSAFFLLLFLIPIVFSCEKKSIDPVPEIIQGFWRYESGIDWATFHGGPIDTYIAYIQLLEDGSVSGFTSRNIFDGTYSYDEQGNWGLEIGAMTRVADTGWSAEFTERIRKADQYSLDGDILKLIVSDTEEELIFTRLSEETCKPIINDEDAFRLLETDEFKLIEVNILGNCLELRIEYGGGCKGIGVAMIGAGAYKESFPPQLDLRIIVEDDDHCEALVREYFHFDLTEIQYDGADQLILNIEGWDNQVTVYY